MIFKLLTLATVLSLSGCAAAPKSEPVVKAVCPTPPPLELAAPERDWQAQMHDFLRGLLWTPPDYRLPTTNAKLSTKY